MKQETSEEQPRKRRHWTVSECQHGCIDVDLGPLVLKLTKRELRELVRLLGDAYVEFGVEDEERTLDSEVDIPHTTPH